LTRHPDISQTEFRISIALDVAPANNADEENDSPTIILAVQFPESYPDEAPLLDIFAPSNAPQHPLLRVGDDKAHLLAALTVTIEENLGMAMIFTIVSTLKEAAEALIAERKAAVNADREAQAEARELEENKKFHGTAVTPETFAEWRLKFQEEMEAARQREEEEEIMAEKKKNRGKEAVVGLTGRQLWERGMAGKMDESDEDDTIPGPEMRRLAV
jgi:hypothetical protein